MKADETHFISKFFKKNKIKQAVRQNRHNTQIAAQSEVHDEKKKPLPWQGSLTMRGPSSGPKYQVFIILV